MNNNAQSQYSGINIEEIKNKCIEFLQQLQPETNPKNFLVEEVEISENNEYLLITLGFDQIKTFSNPTQISRLLQSLETYERTFKVFKINTSNGMVMSMKIRENV